MNFKCEACGRAPKQNPTGMKKVSEMAAQHGIAHSTVLSWINQGWFVFDAEDMPAAGSGATNYLCPRSQARLSAIMQAVNAGVSSRAAFVIVFGADGHSIAATISEAIESLRRVSDRSALQ